MENKVLSIFVDESGDFSQYNPSSPCYYVAMVLHNQAIDETNQYKLSQVADLICTVEAIAQKSVLTKSVSDFFHSRTDFRKNVYKSIVKKKCKKLQPLIKKIGGCFLMCDVLEGMPALTLKWVNGRMNRRSKRVLSGV
ncbi:MAG: DUF3800 domain-containing protein [Lachnospiraceae bacterium]|nr:DUF3800 domain-containing protein [Lachnospiraceae bacterium]